MPKRNGSLDVLRAAAIVMVVNCHAVSPNSSAGLEILKLGGKGVDLFFVLSGWLLGHQLLTELRDTGSIEIKRFWYRRWLRTLPAYYAVLALTFLWQILARGNGALSWSYLFFGQTYATDLPYFGVSWSLCVEEHFYLLVAPLLLLLCRRRTGIVLLALLALPSVCRMFGFYRADCETHVRYDECATGVALAYLAVFAPRAWQRLRALAPGLALLGCLFIGVIILAKLSDYPVQPGPLGWSLMFGSFVLFANSGDLWQRRFHVLGARYIADRAYALYLVHTEALAVVNRIEGLAFVIALPLCWVLSLTMAEVLYRLVERPVMRAREWFSSTCSRDAVASGVQILRSPEPSIVGSVGNQT